MKPVIGSRNRLVRRLSAHANMTGLFRFGEVIQRRDVRSDDAEMSSPAKFASLPLAKAFIPTNEPAGEVDLAQSRPVPSLPVESHPTSPMSAPPAEMDTSQALPVERPIPVPARMDMPASTPLGNIFPAPEQVESSADGEESRPSDGDPVWNRLQTIFNRHKIKNTSQEATFQPQPPAMDPSLPDAPAPTKEEGKQTDAPSGPELSAGNQPGAPASPSVQTKRESSDASAVQRVDPLPPEMKTEINLAQPGPRPASVEGSSPISAPAEIIQDVRESSPINPLPASPHADEVALSKPVDSILSDGTSEPAESEEPDTIISQPGIEPPETGTALQSLPLEAVWAVETVRRPGNPLPPALEDSHEQISGGEGKVRKVENPQAERSSVQRAVVQDHIVQSALQDIQPAQASDSGIEFIPPRRPRPASPATGTNTPVAETSAIPPSAAVLKNSLQRQLETDPEKDTGDPGMVPTEIGPLPEDLWNLVGEATPAAGSEPHQKVPHSEENSMWAEPAPMHDAAPAPFSNSQATQAPLVQRKDASDAITEPESVPPAAGTDAVDEQGGEGVNIEELARQVYSELKHRLGLEWERLHRR